MFLLPVLIAARLSPEQRKEILSNSDAADRNIDFLQFNQVQPAIQTGAWVLFFGAHWCINTQKWTPKYLQVQQRVKSEGINVKMAKIECSTDKELFCTNTFHIDGFPTMLVYVDGKLKEEYPDSDEVEPFYNYIKNLGAIATKSFKNSGKLVQEIPASDKLSDIPEKLNSNNIVPNAPADVKTTAKPLEKASSSFPYLALGGILLFSVAGFIVASRSYRPYQQLNNERSFQD